MRLEGLVARVGMTHVLYRILVGKPKAKRSFGEIGGDGRLTLKSILE